MVDVPRDQIAVAIGLGSNLGDRALNIRTALREVAPYVTIDAVSPFYETPAAYVTDQPAFLNAALTAHTSLSPLALLWSLKYVEDVIGRKPTFRNGPRVIDLDILFYGTAMVRDADLIIPHPRLFEREFALRPLADVAASWIHPETGQTIATMLADLGETIAVKQEGTP